MSADNWTYCPRCAEEQLREDWDLGIFEGEFYIIYAGRCKACKWGYDFKHNERICTDSI